MSHGNPSQVGQNVMCIHNKEMATVKYIGHADFAPGIWIGLELKQPRGETRTGRYEISRRSLGKHSGVVNGRRYFSSKDGHGVMVRPRNISVHGIIGQDLLRPESHYPIQTLISRQHQLGKKKIYEFFILKKDIYLFSLLYDLEIQICFIYLFAISF